MFNTTDLKGQEIMGGRAQWSPSLGKTGGIPLDQRNYSEIGLLGKISIIQCDVARNNPTPTYSNTANTTYYAYSKENKRIEHIYYYRNHKLIKSVDFKNNETPHAHYWNTQMVGRKRHDKKNTFALTERDTRLMNLAKRYNNEAHHR
jgi:hypothetical protein